MSYLPDDIEYAIEHSHILREPDRRIDTFGATRFKFIAVSQPMDSVSTTHIRTGEVQANKPAIIKPTGFNDVELDGFGGKSEEFIEMLRSKGLEPVIFKYGFQFKRTDSVKEVVNDRLEFVKEKVLDQARKDDDPMLAVIECVDSTWEVGLLKFSIDMIQKSTDINAFDFKRKGLF
ncbi:hypothetical protein OAB00_04420 [Akkermansiaceae bacterium]|nr:hypothetical protein [Akkermansiaceae bacterium]